MDWSFRDAFTPSAPNSALNTSTSTRVLPENAVIERSFRTDEEECFFRLEEAPQDHQELNTWYQRFLDAYNTTRPHMGINMLTPKEAIALYHKS